MFHPLTDNIFVLFLLLLLRSISSFSSFAKLNQQGDWADARKSVNMHYRTQKHNVGFSRCYATHLQQQLVDLNRAGYKAKMWGCRRLLWERTPLLCLPSALTASSCQLFNRANNFTSGPTGKWRFTSPRPSKNMPDSVICWLTFWHSYISIQYL